jgi:hypothetical protein
MIKKILIFISLLVVVGCSSTPEPKKTVPKPSSAPVVARPNPIKTPDFKPVDTDQCKAKALQYLVGKSRTEIPIPLEPSQRRVLCSTCAATLDFRADRQTIVFDTDTGLIKSVNCG